MEKPDTTTLGCSVVVVAYNEEWTISDCLRSLIAQDYPKESFEIIVVDGCSEDQTPDIVRGFMNKEPGVTVRLVSNPKRTIASNRNMGIREASFEYVAFTDADCISPPDWLKKLSSGFQYNAEKCQLAAVGGGNRSDETLGKISLAIGFAFQSYISGLGTVQTRGPKTIASVDSLACLNVMYKRERLLSVGGFNEHLKNMGEDWDLNYRLRKEGWQLLYLPDTDVIHKMRKDWKHFVRQMFRYGEGRAKLLNLHRESWSLQYVLPLVFVIGMIISLAAGIMFQSIYFTLPVLYLIIIAGAAFHQSFLSKRLDLWFGVVFAFVIIHFGYGFGEWYGVLSKKEIEKV
jgi:cellulose synthase/poly-beta-1,6-N-acetylglucosamine synthase-like glycosyltransferase